ncbi:hypothetical protein BDN72DRAFT_889364 [Pluteus cervinus]|uniref:Uncharacterized protein n=1 Tax=Pluteus cervinus TaxID=181527 RepID=A0ACD3AJ32_9AGAR|nr:hypothetical protein BDN72DRAFT_889364 [Pluteus cervinus]
MSSADFHPDNTAAEHICCTRMSGPGDGGWGVRYSMDSSYPSPAPSAGGEAIVSEVMLQNKRDPEARTVSISTAFNPVTHPTGLDLIFSSLDCVLFYVDMKVIAKASPRAFQSAISASSTHEPPGVMNIILIQETSPVLNVMLHTLYRTSCARHSPTFETLVDAVNHMPLYDISPAAHIIPSSHIYATLVAYAPLYPLELYGLAGQHQIHELAVATSSHLLSYPLPSMSDEIAQRMGALYLKRLFDLHLNRFSALNEMLHSPPHLHAPTIKCTSADQRSLRRAWVLVSAYLAWETRADLSTHGIKLAFGPSIERLSCQLCRGSLEAKVHEIVVKWASVKSTI